jgi:hypothetical protein
MKYPNKNGRCTVLATNVPQLKLRPKLLNTSMASKDTEQHQQGQLRLSEALTMFVHKIANQSYAFAKGRVANQFSDLELALGWFFTFNV